MKNTVSMSARLVTIIRWLARIIGTLSVASFLVFFIGDCFTKGGIPIGSDRVAMTVFMFITFIGIAIAWKWEGIGGVTAIVGTIGFTILAPASLAKAAVFFMTAMYGLPALIFVLCWWQTRKQITPKAT
jgi:hypothetical protein